MTPDAAGVTEVAVRGWTWTATLVAVLNLIVGGAFVAWIKSRPRMRELEKQSEEKLRDDLIARETRLESQRAHMKAGSSTAALQPIVVRSTDTVTRYADIPAGHALCLAPDRVSRLDQLDRELFPPIAAGAGAGAVPAYGSALAVGRISEQRWH
jgi:hypothetical protein